MGFTVTTVRLAALRYFGRRLRALGGSFHQPGGERGTEVPAPFDVVGG